MQLLEHGFLPPHTQAFAALRSNGTLQLFGAMELAAFEARFFEAMELAAFEARTFCYHQPLIFTMTKKSGLHVYLCPKFKPYLAHTPYTTTHTRIVRHQYLCLLPFSGKETM
jgi:hypothetical protein